MKFFIIIPIFALISNIILSIYIYLKRRKTLASQLFFLSLLSVILHLFGEIFFQLSTYPRYAFYWISVYWLGYFFMPILFFIFTTYYPKRQKILFKQEKLKALLVAFPLMFMYLLLFSGDFIREIVISDYVNYVVYGPIYWIVVLYIGLFLYAGVYNLWNYYKKSKIEAEREQLKPVIVAVGIWTIIGIALDSFILKALGFGELKLASISLTAFGVAIGYAIWKHRLLVIKPVMEKETKRKQKYDLKKGEMYYVQAQKPAKAFDMFADQVKHGKQGLCISTRRPAAIRDKYELKRTPIIWVTSLETEETALKPKELVELTKTVGLFIENARNGAILLHGITELIRENGSQSVYATLYDIEQKLKENNSRVVVSINNYDKTLLELQEEKEHCINVLKDAKVKFFQRKIGEPLYNELNAEKISKLADIEARIWYLERDAEKEIDNDDLEQKKLLVERAIKFIDYKCRKREIDMETYENIIKEKEKQLIELESKSKKKRTVVE